MARQRRLEETLDRDLADLPRELRWREWMARIEAVIFAAPQPVTREVLAGLVGPDCSIDLIIEDIRAELRDRPYDLVAVAGGWQFRTRPRHAAAVQAALSGASSSIELTRTEMVVLASIAYHQPVTRAAVGQILGREVSRDVIGRLRSLELVTYGPRSPQPGAPYTFVTTKAFLSHFGLNTLRDLPDIEALEDAGLLHGDDRGVDLLPQGREDGDDAEQEAAERDDEPDAQAEQGNRVET